MYSADLKPNVSFVQLAIAPHKSNPNAYFIGTYGNRNNRFQPYDCATKMAYDYSKVGDKNVQIRNLDTDEVFTYYQADVGALPDAIIDIWGEDNIRELAGTPDGAPTDNANNVRYYHERFSDQTAPAR